MIKEIWELKYDTNRGTLLLSDTPPWASTPWAPYSIFTSRLFWFAAVLRAIMTYHLHHLILKTNLVDLANCLDFFSYKEINLAFDQRYTFYNHSTKLPTLTWGITRTKPLLWSM